jgi:putrescine transport system permease protein
MNTNFAVYVGIVYSYLPFMIAAVSNLEARPSLLEVARPGRGGRRSFFSITFPLSLGVIAGSLLVFIPAVGEYVLTLLGRTDQLWSRACSPTSSSATALPASAVASPCCCWSCPS